MPNALFFIAIIPPPAIAAEITEWKHHCRNHFHSSRALNSPAHITLIPPFQWRTEESGALEALLKGFALGRKSFFINLDGFGHFKNQVIFVKLEQNPDLNTLQAELKAVMESLLGPSEKERTYHPHITLAFRDLSREAFIQAWAHFGQREYVRVFGVNDLCLLRHQNGQWHIHRTFTFKN